MEAMKTSDGSFTPALLLALGLMVLNVILITQLRDPQVLAEATDH
jgi:hypothetical protein